MPAPNHIRIRPATPADLETVAAFNIALAQESEDKILVPATVHHGVREALRDPLRCRYFVAEIDGAAAGQTMITFEWSDWRNGWFWWIQSVYVHPMHRRRGVFRALHDHIRNEAKNRPDVCGLRLYVYRANKRALETYRRLGMAETDYHLYEDDWSPPVDGKKAS